MIRPPKMAVLLLSVHPLLDQCLLHLHPTHMTDLATYLPRPELVIILIFRSEHLHLITYQRSREGRAPLLVSLVTDEPT